MRSSVFILATALCSVVNAQRGIKEDAVPFISRMCLWNANDDTWSDLGLKKDQVRRLEELRRQFPAVVEGQWLVEEQEGGTNGSGTGLSATRTDAGAKNVVRSDSLQLELRSILTPKEMNAWWELCHVHDEP